MLKQKRVTVDIAPSKITVFRSPLLWLVLLIGLSITFVVWRISNGDIEEQTKQRFDSRAEQIVTAVEQRMHAYEQVLRGGVGLFRTQPTITRHQWHEYVENANLAKNYPGIQNFAVDFPIPANEKNAHIAQVRAEGHPEYSISPEQPERPVYHSLVYVEPFGGRNLRAFGFDMYTNPIRREAMDRAIDLGLPSVSGMVKLAQETNENVQHGFIYCLPVYDNGRLIDTPDQRRAALRALVCGGFRTNDLMRGIFGARTSDLELEVFDGVITQQTQMYSSWHDDKIAVSTFSRTVPLEVGGRTWNLRVSANQAFIDSISWTQSQLVMVSGTLLSFALFFGLGFWLDIEKRIQNRVLRNSQIYNAVQDSVKESLLVIDKSGIVISSNPTAAQRLALSPDQLVGRSIFEVMPPEILAERRALCEEVMKSGRPIAFEDAHRGRDYLNNLYPAIDPWTQGEAIVMVEIDITERKQAEELLRERDSQLQTIVENLTEGLAVSDLDGQLLHFNRAALDLHGFATLDECRQHLTKFADTFELSAMDGTVWPVAQWPLARILDGENLRNLEVGIRHLHVGWRKVFNYGGTLVRDGDGTSLMAIVTISDITERKQAEEALGESRARLEALTRRLLDVQEAERRLIASELHDEVGGVLTAVKLNLQALRRGHTAEQGEAALVDGLALVDGAIQSVRSLSLDLRPAVLDDLGLIPALKWYCDRQARRAGVAIELALDAIDLKATPQLESACFRIVQEAVTNALRHAGARRIKVALRRDDGHFVIEIADDGGGFDPVAARERGLAGENSGLLGMEERAELLGGRFGIEAAPGAGARVWVEFAMPEDGVV